MFPVNVLIQIYRKRFKGFMVRWSGYATVGPTVTISCSIVIDRQEKDSTDYLITLRWGVTDFLGPI